MPLLNRIYVGKKRLPERNGQPCRQLPGRRYDNMVWIEFEDGKKLLVSKWCVKKPPVTQPVEKMEDF